MRRSTHCHPSIMLALVCFGVLSPVIHADDSKSADWPMYLRDVHRSGHSPQSLTTPLHLQWSVQMQSPAPAWPPPAKHDYWHNKYNLDARVTYDRAFQVISVGDHVWFATSSEDKVVCLDANTGKLQWSYFAEGPIRCAPTYWNGALYFGSDDGCVYCIDAANGKLRWKTLVAPSPRRIPGNQRVISAWPIRTDVLIEDGKGYVCAGVFPSQGVWQATIDVATGKLLAKTRVNASAQGYLERKAGKLYVPTGRDPAGAYIARLKRRGKTLSKSALRLSKEFPFAFIGGGKLRFGGGDNKIAAFDGSSAKMIWSSKIDGKAYSLAIAQGRLLVGTDQGAVYCFASTKPARKPATHIAKKTVKIPVAQQVQSWAKNVASKSRPRKGWCLMLGCNLEYAMALANRTKWQFVLREVDRTRVDALRRRIDGSGLNGRIAVHHGSYDDLPYTDYLFNTIVVGKVNQPADKIETEVKRVLRPITGVAHRTDKSAPLIRRGALAGAGEWSHQYGDVGNTVCSNDRLVKGELQLQWFGRPGPRPMIDRHHRTAAPLYRNGRMFIPGEDRVIGVDAYNGTILWDRRIKDSRRVAVLRDCSYLAAGSQYVFVAAADHCLAIDPQTGETKRTLHVPDTERTEWGCIVALTDNIVLGSAVRKGSSRREQCRKVIVGDVYGDLKAVVCSDLLFATDPNTGRRLWQYQSRGAIPNPTIAACDGTIYFVESTNPKTMLTKLGRAKLPELLSEGSQLVALDWKTGKVRWRKETPFHKTQHVLYVAATQGRVITVGSRNSGTNRRTASVLYDVTVFNAKTGKPLWSMTQDQKRRIGGDHGEQDLHPVIVGEKLYCEPYAWNLHTGKPLDWQWPYRRGRRGCGTISAGAATMFFRHQSLCQFDMASNKAKKVTTVTRPGCWVNLIPAGGLLLAPEASSGCSCNFAVQTSLALVPVRK